MQVDADDEGRNTDDSSAKSTYRKRRTAHDRSSDEENIPPSPVPPRKRAKTTVGFYSKCLDHPVSHATQNYRKQTFAAEVRIDLINDALFKDSFFLAPSSRDRGWPQAPCCKEGCKFVNSRFLYSNHTKEITGGKEA